MKIEVHKGKLPSHDYMIIHNDLARGKWPVPLKCVARIIVIYLLSLPPEGWQTTREQILASIEEGETAFDNACREAEKAGYIKRVRRRDSAGVWLPSQWYVTDDPIQRPITTPPPGEPHPENPGVDPTSGNIEEPQVAPHPGFPRVENPGVLEDGSKEDGLEEGGAPGEPDTNPTPSDSSTPRDERRPNGRELRKAFEFLEEFYGRQDGRAKNRKEFLNLASRYEWTIADVDRVLNNAKSYRAYREHLGKPVDDLYFWLKQGEWDETMPRVGLVAC